MSEAYDKELSSLAEKTADELGIPVQKGVYTAVTGRLTKRLLRFGF